MKIKRTENGMTDHMQRHSIPCPPFMHKYVEVATSKPCHTDGIYHEIKLHKCKICGARKVTITGKKASSHEYVQFVDQCWTKHEINLFEND